MKLAVVNQDLAVTVATHEQHLKTRSNLYDTNYNKYDIGFNEEEGSFTKFQKR